MGRIMVITMTNQKGGVSKTTTAWLMGIGLQRRGFKVMLVDLDPQTSLSYLLQADKKKPAISDLLTGLATIQEVIQATPDGLFFIAGNTRMVSMISGIEQTAIKETFDPVKGIVDYIILDTPPALSALTIAAAIAADRIIIPTQASSMALSGIMKLYTSAIVIAQKINPELIIDGILLTRYNGRSIINRQLKALLDDIATACSTKVYQTTIRQSVAVEEAQSAQKDLFAYAPNAPVTKDYERFIDEFLRGES